MIPNRLSSMLDSECPGGQYVGLYLQKASLKMLDDGMLFYEGLGAWEHGFCVDQFYGRDQEPFFSGR